MRIACGSIREEDNIVDAEIFDYFRNRNACMTRVDNDNIAVMLGKEGYKRVTRGFLDNKHCLFLIVFGHVYYGKRLVSRKEAGIAFSRNADTIVIRSYFIAAVGVVDFHSVRFCRHIRIHRVDIRKNAFIVCIIIYSAYKRIGNDDLFKFEKRSGVSPTDFANS